MKSAWNVPNLLTVLRVALVPVFLWLLFADSFKPALAVFLLAALTDFVDGWWARTRGEITDFGRLADPIADKALTGAAWIGLSLLGLLPWVATWLILVREVSITAIRLRLADRVVVAADQGGKWKTTFQILTISLWLLLAPASGAVAVVMSALLWATVLGTILTGVRYLVVLVPALRSAK